VDILIALIAFAAHVVAWFVLPGSPRRAHASAHEYSEGLASAA
jgi:hypothetical protein